MVKSTRNPSLASGRSPSCVLKTIIIITFIITLTRVNSQPNPSQPPNQVSKYDNNHFYSYVDQGQRSTRLRT